MPLLSAIIFLPILAAVLLLLVPALRGAAIRVFTIVVMLLQFVLTLVLLGRFDSSIAGMQHVERLAWINNFGIEYHIGVDGISLWLVVLTKSSMLVSSMVWSTRWVR